MTVEERSAIRREIRVTARPETIFGLLTEPAKYVRWKGALAELDPRPGGIYRVQLNNRDIARGRYVEVVPYSRVVFTWGWEGGGPVPPGLEHRRDHPHPRWRRHDRAARAPGSP